MPSGQSAGYRLITSESVLGCFYTYSLFSLVQISGCDVNTLHFPFWIGFGFTQANFSGITHHPSF